MFPYDPPLLPLWLYAFFGWYDIILAVAIILSFASKRLKLDKDTFVFILTLSIIVCLSLFKGSELGIGYFLDAIVWFLRFALTFSLGKSLVNLLGTQATESILIALFIILSISALLAYSLQFGINNRIYASTMTSPSFAQVAAVVCFIAVMRRYNIIIIISSIFLFLTFSRTSIVLFIALFLAYSKNLPVSTRFKYYFIITALASLMVFLLFTYGADEYESVISSRTDVDELSSLNSRDMIWGHALHLFNSGYIPLFGVGYNATQSLIARTNFTSINEIGEETAVAHFHSIFLEYGFGLGIFSIIIFFLIFKRIWQTFYYNCYPSFFIFTFFLICQAVDFTLTRPKEIILWSLMLGIAEGHWKFERKQLTQSVREL